MGLLRIIGIKAPSVSAARGKSGLAGFSIPLAGDGGLQDLRGQPGAASTNWFVYVWLRSIVLPLTFSSKV